MRRSIWRIGTKGAATRGGRRRVGRGRDRHGGALLGPNGASKTTWRVRDADAPTAGASASGLTPPRTAPRSPADCRPWPLAYPDLTARDRVSTPGSSASRRRPASTRCRLGSVGWWSHRPVRALSRGRAARALARGSCLSPSCCSSTNPSPGSIRGARPLAASARAQPGTRWYAHAQLPRVLRGARPGAGPVRTGRLGTAPGAGDPRADSTARTRRRASPAPAA
jgi:hypothetical protein